MGYSDGKGWLVNSQDRCLGVVLCGVVVAAVISGCSPRPPSPAASSSAATSPPVPSASAVVVSAGCASGDVPLTTLVPMAAGEPTLALPTPSGWEYSASMNSRIIRGLVANIRLRANDFTPNAVVTLEDLTGKVGDAQQGIDAEVHGAEQAGITVTGRTPGTVCGNPSATITYTLKGHSVTALVTAAADGQKVWAATLTVQTAEPDNRTYIADAQTILNNFQFIVPSHGSGQ